MTTVKISANVSFSYLIDFFQIFQVQSRVSSKKMILWMVSVYWSSWKDIFILERFKPSVRLIFMAFWWIKNVAISLTYSQEKRFCRKQ